MFHFSLKWSADEIAKGLIVIIIFLPSQAFNAGLFLAYLLQELAVTFWFHRPWPAYGHRDYRQDENEHLGHLY